MDGAALSVRPRRLPKYVSDLAERSYECETERKNATAMFQGGDSIDILPSLSHVRNWDMSQIET